MQSLCTVRLCNHPPLPGGGVYSRGGTRALRELKGDTFTRPEDEGLACYVIDAEMPVSKKNFGIVNGTPQLGTLFKGTDIALCCHRSMEGQSCLHVLPDPMDIPSLPSNIIQSLIPPLARLWLLWSCITTRDLSLESLSDRRVLTLGWVFG